MWMKLCAGKHGASQPVRKLRAQRGAERTGCARRKSSPRVAVPCRAVSSLFRLEMILVLRSPAPLPNPYDSSLSTWLFLLGVDAAALLVAPPRRSKCVCCVCAPEHHPGLHLRKARQPVAQHTACTACASTGVCSAPSLVMPPSVVAVFFGTPELAILRPCCMVPPPPPWMWVGARVHSRPHPPPRSPC